MYRLKSQSFALLCMTAMSSIIHSMSAQIIAQTAFKIGDSSLAPPLIHCNIRACVGYRSNYTIGTVLCKTVHTCISHLALLRKAQTGQTQHYLCSMLTRNKVCTISSSRGKTGGVHAAVMDMQAQRAQALSEQQGLGSRVDFRVADALQQPFPDGRFDLVWSLESGEHMPDKQKFVGELARVCAPGGKIIIVTWCHRCAPSGCHLQALM